MRSRCVFGILSVFLLAVSCFFLCTDGAGAAAAGNIRVALARDNDQLFFTVKGNYEVVDKTTGQVLAVPQQGEKMQVALKGNRIALADIRSDYDYGSFRGPLLVREASCRAAIVNSNGRVTEQSMATSQVVNGDGRISALEATRAPTVKSANKTMELAGGSDTLNLVTLSSNTSAAVRYRGDMEFTLEDGVLTAVNVLNIEDYLRGVVPAEIPSYWHPEALKAQAVAARNYALESAQTSRGIFDVRCDVSSQVYGGYDAESPATNKAVDETKGMVMLEGNRMVSAFFHSCSGGYIENSEDVWNNSVSYIRTKPDPYDYNDVYYNWHVNYTTEQLIKKLASAGYEFTEIEDIKELAYTASGERVKKLQIVGEGMDGEPVTVVISNADNVRIALDLRSSLFRLTKKYDRDENLVGVEIEGSGWGHGLGMSQYGARGMAEKGYKYQDILKYYYSGVELAGDYGRR